MDKKNWESVQKDQSLKFKLNLKLLTLIKINSIKIINNLTKINYKIKLLILTFNNKIMWIIKTYTILNIVIKTSINFLKLKLKIIKILKIKKILLISNFRFSMILNSNIAQIFMNAEIELYFFH